MTLFAVLMSLVALATAFALWLVATVSEDLIRGRFPDYAAQIYRTPSTALRESPIRLIPLLFTPLPAGADPSMRLFRVLAILFTGSTVAAILSWIVA